MKTTKILSLVTLIAGNYVSLAYAGTIVVTNTNDSGTGSLRQAITEAENLPGPDSIVFNIPVTDPSYNSTTGVWTIQPATELPYLESDSTVIDGVTQTGNQGDKNPQGPEIEINGSGLLENGIVINGSCNIIRGLVINRCKFAGINIQNHYNWIKGNYIGTDASGVVRLPNGDGIVISGLAKHNIIGGNTNADRNLLSGNNDSGIKLYAIGTDSNIIQGNFIGTNYSGEDTLGNTIGGVFLGNYSSATLVGGANAGERNIICGSSYPGTINTGNGITLVNSHNNKITGNYIGTNVNGTRSLPNIDYGISLNKSQNNIIGGFEPGEGNAISGNGWGGVFIRFGTSRNNIIAGNFIGTGPDGRINLGNASIGIELDYATRDNCIGPGNIIMNNGNYGIKISHDTTIRNTITRNSISNHTEFGIYNQDGANNAITAPVILEVSAAGVTGTSFAGCLIEIFSDEFDEGATFEGYTIADAGGSFSWSGLVTGLFVTATATDTAGNTSQFSEPFEVTPAVYMPSKTTDGFALEQNYPNPFGIETEIPYSIPSGGHVTLKVFDLAGMEINRLIDEYQSSGSFSVTWHAKNSRGIDCPAGIYYYTIETSGFRSVKKMVLVRR
jgi:hypothetical protein